jgi:hypothetical protein
MKKCILLLCCTVSLFGAPIASLFNSGVDASGVALVGGDGVIDTHWQVVSGPGIVSPAAAVTYKHPAYFANSAISRWISNSSSGSPGSGNFVFRTTFDLTGFNPLATSITVRCATDNALTGVSLNGNSATGDCDSFGSFSSFVLASGFSAGVNTLDFTVTDFGPPMAFRVEFDSETRELPTGIPEPSTFLLSAVAIGALVIHRRTRLIG